MDGNWLISDAFVAEWNRIRAKVDSFSGPGIHNSRDSLSQSPLDELHNVPPRLEFVIAKITGIASGATGGRYAISIFYDYTNNTPGATLVSSDLGTLGTNTFELWNVGEVGSGGAAALKTGQYVIAFLGGYNKTSNQPIYLTWCSSGMATYVLQVGTPGTRPAMYAVSAFLPTSSDIVTTGTSPVTASELGAGSGTGGSGIGINVMELNYSTNNLTAGQIGVGFLWHTNSDGTNIYVFWCLSDTSCSGGG